MNWGLVFINFFIFLYFCCEYWFLMFLKCACDWIFILILKMYEFVFVYLVRNLFFTIDWICFPFIFDFQHDWICFPFFFDFQHDCLIFLTSFCFVWLVLLLHLNFRVLTGKTGHLTGKALYHLKKMGFNCAYGEKVL